MMMVSRVRVLVLVALVGSQLGCAANDTATVDPEAAQLDPPVVIVDEPGPGPEPEAEPEPEPEEEVASPAAVAKDPDTEVITFAGEDAEPGMADEITGTPKREDLPSMMSDVIHGPNK